MRGCAHDIHNAFQPGYRTCRRNRCRERRNRIDEIIDAEKHWPGNAGVELRNHGDVLAAIAEAQP